MLVAMLVISSASFAQVEISVNFAPPELPVYEQPLCPGDGYIWTPGYWAWDGSDYYWVPGTWVMAPEPGYLWTPGYWAWGGGGYVFHQGYWGPQVGFYGGIDYGYGYFGHGYEGGRWDGGHFYYNRSVNNVNATEIHNVYNTTVVNNHRGPGVSYNGGNGGINARPTSDEERAAHEKHVPPVAAQTQHFEAARANPALRASENHGKPPVAATPKPAAFNERGAVPAKEGGHYNPPPRPENAGGHSATPVHPKDLPPAAHASPPNTGNPNLDRKYQQQQQKMYAKQDQERQKLQQKQDQEHQKMQQRQASDAQKQQMEQRHQQQTRQMQQKHAQQQQQIQARQQPHQQPHEGEKPANGKH